MLEFVQHKHRPFLPMLLLHDDADREFDHTSGAEDALQQAGEDGWTVVSVEQHWNAVFQPRNPIGSRRSPDSDDAVIPSPSEYVDSPTAPRVGLPTRSQAR